MNETDEKAQKVDKKELFNHIKEECVKNPFYLTKMLVSSIGRNAIDMVVRIAIYVLVLYPLLTSVLHVPTGVAYLLVTLSIVLYYSALSIYHKMVKQIKENGNIVKKDEEGLT